MIVFPMISCESTSEEDPDAQGTYLPREGILCDEMPFDGEKLCTLFRQVINITSEKMV
jgi:hypothetical protein